MWRTISRSIFFVAIGVALVSCAAQQPMTMPWKTAFTPQDLNSKVQSGRYLKKVDSFLVILDASGSMADMYEGRPKVHIAKDIVSRMNQTIPDIELVGGLRIFGMFMAETKLIYGITKYSKPGLEGALDTIPWPRGESPLHWAINAAGQDLLSTLGKTALIIVSDGFENDMDQKAALKAAKDLKGQLGDRLCIYTILVGNDPKGRKLMQQIAEASRCGFFVTADSITSAGGMAAFVEQGFLTAVKDSDGDGVPDDLDRCPGTPRNVKVDSVGCPLDSDRDGVPDYMDKCPGTPGGVKVDRVGCPLDSDGDGVPDYMDKCPGTPKGAPVDRVGCPLDSDGDGVPDYLDRCPETPEGARVDERGCWAFLGTFLFDVNKYDLKPEVYPALRNAVKILNKNPDLKVEIQGHTDSTGSAAYNQQLSEKRAQAVYNYFVSQGVPSSQLTVKGYGLTRPAYSNATADGRRKNRRVEFAPTD